LKLERKENSLQKELNFYKLALDTAELGIWDYNPKTGDCNFSSRWLSMLGYEADELPSTYDTWLELLHPDDRQAAVDTLDNFLKHPTGLLSLRFRVRAKNEDWRWIHSKMKVTERNSEDRIAHVVGTHFDITESQRMEADLGATRFIFDNASIGIYRIASDAKILDINRQAAMHLGYSTEEILNMTIFDIDPNVKRKQWDRIWRVLLEQGTDTFERTHLRKDGTEMPVEVTSQLLEYDGQQFSISFVKDITERKNAEREKEKLQNQLLQSQKMESIGLLAGGIAHDFNNILSAIIGNAELAMRVRKSDKSAAPYLQQICDAAFRSSDLIKQLLAFARKQTIKPVVFDINGKIAQMINMLRRLIGENIKLQWLPSQEPCRVMLDPSQIDQLLANLMVNAKDAIDGAGMVTIETNRITVNEGYRNNRSWLTAGTYIMLSVSDNGCGMDKETQERIFDPFFTTKGIGRGTGLGLATVYGIVKQNKGCIHVQSKIGKGSSFKLYFPATEMPVEEINSGIFLESPFKGSETVLIVEDDAYILEIAEAILIHLGYTVITANAPGLAIKKAQASDQKIDLLLTDVVMPLMNGRELAQRFEEITPGIKCLYMTGYTSDVIANHGVLHEGVNFISKPFTIHDLARKVRETLES